MRTSKEDIVNLRSLVGSKIINIYGTEYDSGYFEVEMLIERPDGTRFIFNVTDGWEWQCYLESDGT